MGTPLILPVFWQENNSITGGELVFGPNVVPVVQNALLAIGTETPQSVSNTVVLTSLYNITVFAEGYGTGPGGSTVTVRIAWVNAQGNEKFVDLTLNGDSDDIQQENYVLLALVGTNITVTTMFDGAYTFMYDIAVAIAILPTAQVR